MDAYTLSISDKTSFQHLKKIIALLVGCHPTYAVLSLEGVLTKDGVICSFCPRTVISFSVLRNCIPITSVHSPAKTGLYSRLIT